MKALSWWGGRGRCCGGFVAARSAKPEGAPSITGHPPFFTSGHSARWGQPRARRWGIRYWKDKAGHLARAPDPNMGDSRPRMWLVKERVSLKGKVQSLLCSERRWGAGSFKNGYRRWHLASPYIPPRRWAYWWQKLCEIYILPLKGISKGFSKVTVMGWKKHSAGLGKGWVLVAVWPWVNYFPSWVSVSSFVNRAADSLRLGCSGMLTLITEGLQIHGDVCLESHRWSLSLWPRRAECEGRQREEAKQVSWRGASWVPAIPVPLPCLSNLLL